MSWETNVQKILYLYFVGNKPNHTCAGTYYTCVWAKTYRLVLGPKPTVPFWDPTVLVTGTVSDLASKHTVPVLGPKFFESMSGTTKLGGEPVEQKSQECLSRYILGSEPFL